MQSAIFPWPSMRGLDHCGRVIFIMVKTLIQINFYTCHLHVCCFLIKEVDCFKIPWIWLFIECFAALGHVFHSFLWRQTCSLLGSVTFSVATCMWHSHTELFLPPPKCVTFTASCRLMVSVPHPPNTGVRLPAENPPSTLFTAVGQPWGRVHSAGDPAGQRLQRRRAQGVTPRQENQWEKIDTGFVQSGAGHWV